MNFFYVSGGALVCDEPIRGVTSDMGNHPWQEWYGHRYFVAESMSEETARRFAFAFGGTLIEGIPPSRQLVGATVDISRELTRQAFYGEHPRKVVA